MARTTNKHMSIEDREVIEEGIKRGDSARKIAGKIGVSASTVIREVENNRVVREKKSLRKANLAVRCIHYSDCQASGSACEKCSTRLTTCKHCRTRNCIDACESFVRKMCPATGRWPYTCPEGCAKRGYCGFPKCSYSADAAQKAYEKRLALSRSGIDISDGELKAMKDIVVPLLRQGQSFEAIWATHRDELPVCVRTAYNYQEAGLFVPDVELPRKVRLKPRKKAEGGPGRDRVDRTGRTYADFRGLPLEEASRVVQADSVEGLEGNSRDILSLHFVSCGFQVYLPKRHGDPASVVAWMDVMEKACGSRGAFEAAVPVVLADRGVEFDDWEGMERSCLSPGERRCRVFYCDAQATNQKSQAERNHERLRRILPKGRSDFDALDAWDVSVCCSHVNSYPLAGRANKCPFELAESIIPRSLLDELGLARIPADEVVLKPYLMKHAVDR